MLFSSSSLLSVSLWALAVRASPASRETLSKNALSARQLDLPDLEGPGVIDDGGEPDDGELELDVPPEDDEWRSIGCDHEGVINAGDDVAWRCKSRESADTLPYSFVGEWTLTPTKGDQVQAGEAWNEILQLWPREQGITSLSFPEWVSNYFNGPQNFECQKLVTGNGCKSYTQCHDTNAPAGYFILNSFVYLSNILWNFYDSLSKAKSDIATEAGTMVDIFSPAAVNNAMPLAVIIDIVMIGFAGMSAPMWNSVLKNRPFFQANPNTLGTLKDSVNGMVSGGLTLVKDVTRADSRLSTTNSMQTRLQAITDIWFESTDTFSEAVFSGEFGDLLRLSRFMEDGQLLDEQRDVLSAAEIKEISRRALFAMLIPIGWKISGQDLGPFILEGDIGCEEYLDDIVLSSSVQDQSRVCVDGKSYFLVGASDPSKNCQDTSEMGGHCDGFQVLPGMDQLDGSLWGGITKEDIVNGAVNTFDENGGQNGAAAIDPVNDEFLSTVQDMNIQAPGFFNLAVCGNIPAERNYWNNYKGGEKSANYPCD